MTNKISLILTNITRHETRSKEIFSRVKYEYV